MRKLIIALSVGFVSILSANDGAKLFATKCAMCHVVEFKDKSSLLGPPINKVMIQVKTNFPKKEDAIAFIKDYTLNPDPKKTICPSIDLFGVMPSQKGVVTLQELDKIANYIYENFPKDMQKMKKEHAQFTFEEMDSNKDGYISKEEFNIFRGKKDGIDPKRFKYDYFFRKIDKNGDGKWDKEEFREFVKIMKGEDALKRLKK